MCYIRMAELKVIYIKEIEEMGIDTTAIQITID